MKKDSLPSTDANTAGNAREAILRMVRSSYVVGPVLLRLLMRLRVRICPFERLVGLVSDGSTVLDVGCGSGLFLMSLAASRSKITGLGFDSSATAIALATAASKEGVNCVDHDSVLRFQLLSVDEAWPMDEYDVVSMIDVLHHIPASAQKAVLTQAISRVRPGGVLVYKDMADRPLVPALLNRLHDLVLARQWIAYRSISQVESWAREAGCRVEVSDRFRRLWYVHELRAFRRL